MSSRALIAIFIALIGAIAGVLADEPAKAPRAPDAILNQYCNAATPTTGSRV
jgi:hypothetical protein